MKSTREYGAERDKETVVRTQKETIIKRLTVCERKKERGIGRKWGKSESSVVWVPWSTQTNISSNSTERILGFC